MTSDGFLKAKHLLETVKIKVSPTVISLAESARNNSSDAAVNVCQPNLRGADSAPVTGCHTPADGNDRLFRKQKLQRPETGCLDKWKIDRVCPDSILRARPRQRERRRFARAAAVSDD